MFSIIEKSFQEVSVMVETMQYQIRDPEGFARMLKKIIETGKLYNGGG